MSRKVEKPNPKALQRRVEILEVDVDALNQERERMYQELSGYETRVRALEERLSFLACQLEQEVKL